MAIIPFGDRILVKPLPREETTKSGIYIAESTEGPILTKGIVLSLGEGKTLSDGKLKPIGLECGQTVYFQRGGMFPPAEIQVGDEKCLILTSDQVIASIRIMES